jgi:hypothetical protein
MIVATGLATRERAGPRAFLAAGSSSTTGFLPSPAPQVRGGPIRRIYCLASITQEPHDGSGSSAGARDSAFGAPHTRLRSLFPFTREGGDAATGLPIACPSA